MNLGPVGAVPSSSAGTFCVHGAATGDLLAGAPTHILLVIGQITEPSQWENF